MSRLGKRSSPCVEEVMELLMFCLSATYLAFSESMYQQTYGTVMWSPESVTIAKPLMEDVEQTALATTDIPFWKWYVDNTCTALTVHRLQKLLGCLNRVEPSIQFTVKAVRGKASLSGCTVAVRHGRNCTLVVKLN